MSEQGKQEALNPPPPPSAPPKKKPEYLLDKSPVSWTNQLLFFFCLYDLQPRFQGFSLLCRDFWLYDLIAAYDILSRAP